MNCDKDLFGKISTDEFFQNYWQKKPIVFEAALTDFSSPVSPDELAGLACEEDIESRLILERGGEKAWQVLSGPLEEETLRNLPDSHWSLSVQGVDRILPEVSQLLQYFRFLPNWLLDDILVSYAPDCGSVGAHIDNYDVFIIQGQGRRRWLLGGEPQWNETYREGLDIKLLKEFEHEHEWELNSGDILYIPRRFAHHGIALGECLNYSVGFLAPTEIELINAFTSWSMEFELPEKYLKDPTLAQQESPGEITERSLAVIKKHMKSFVDSPRFNDWFGQHITEPKALFVPPEQASHVSGEELKRRMSSGAAMLPTEGLKRSWIASDPAMLFIEGQNESPPGRSVPRTVQTYLRFGQHFCPKDRRGFRMGLKRYGNSSLSSITRAICSWRRKMRRNRFLYS